MRLQTYGRYLAPTIAAVEFVTIDRLPQRRILLHGAGQSH